MKKAGGSPHLTTFERTPSFKFDQQLTSPHDRDDGGMVGSWDDHPMIVMINMISGSLHHDRDHPTHFQHYSQHSYHLHPFHNRQKI